MGDGVIVGDGVIIVGVVIIGKKTAIWPGKKQ